MANDSPCLDCPDRVFGCFAQCERFIEWKERSNERKRKIYEVKKREGMYNDFRIESIRKTRRRK